MYLSRILPDIRHAGVRRALRDCNELHRDLMSAFPDTQTEGSARSEEKMLFRVERGRRQIELLMTSESVPDSEKLRQRGYLLVPGAVKDISALERIFCSDMTLGFEILTYPSKKCAFGQKNSRRVFLRTESERADWFRRQGEKYGFRVCQLQEAYGQTSLDGTKNGMRIHYDAVRMTGVLMITDPAAFWQAYCCGIGAGKAYGLGMLTVSRVG